MAFDIYGNDLRRGYCEVHPHVQQEYPFDLCYASDRSERHIQRVKRPAVKSTSGTVRVVIDELVKRITRLELNEQFIDVDFGGNYMIQIEQYPDPFPQDNNGVWKVTNAMNGYGDNCFDEFKNCEVTILND